MERIMLVTVGTSLFQSASWKFNDWMRGKIPQYEKKWKSAGTTENRGPLISPEQRLRNGGIIIDQLTDLLAREGPAKWAKHFETGIKRDQLMRYSAELSTLFELGLDFDNDFKKGLLTFKNNLWLIADPQSDDGLPNKQFIAALHLKAYLNTLAPQLGADILEVQGISSTAPATLLDKHARSGLLRLRDEVKKRLDQLPEGSELYIAASAGYKVYGVLLGPFLYSSKVIIVYRHEEGNLLLRITRDKIKVGDSEVINPDKENYELIEEHGGPGD